MIILNVVQGWALIYVTSGWLRDCFCCQEDQVWIRWKCGIEARERLAIYRHVSHTWLYMHVLPVCLTASQCVKISLHTRYIKHMLVTLSEFVSVKQQWSQLEWPSKLICKWQWIHTQKRKKKIKFVLKMYQIFRCYWFLVLYWLVSLMIPSRPFVEAVKQANPSL